MTALDAVAIALGAFLILVGIAHFLLPRYFRSLVPPWMRTPTAAVAATGALEIALGIAVLVPATRAAGAWVTAALFAVYTVAVHGDAALRASQQQERWLDRPSGVVARLLIHIVYLAWAVGIALGA
ncbi:hypothetical protein ER308_11370 [Egibacter rhizosphaerae]|uniref:DoxX family membrane protein n=1 Tax=Egibacter rhizosphaerae TaxID=1670831 RepID=A0A411YFR1_9ACTN|nr:hypothetical protein [Egibacter rhizosphaerae]QBI20104.1 hypothetical protein ER308_11370 [Egibacter rhizosphaerae]